MMTFIIKIENQITTTHSQFVIRKRRRWAKLLGLVKPNSAQQEKTNPTT
ncbi:hypothetical protein [Planktothrix sp. PCC 11201]|nr:hypothetical protein [Planktothrix sp. PCC 11201]